VQELLTKALREIESALDVLIGRSLRQALVEVGLGRPGMVHASLGTPPHTLADPPAGTPRVIRDVVAGGGDPDEYRSATDITRATTGTAPARDRTPDMLQELKESNRSLHVLTGRVKSEGGFAVNRPGGLPFGRSTSDYLVAQRLPEIGVHPRSGWFTAAHLESPEKWHSKPPKPPAGLGPPDWNALLGGGSGNLGGEERVTAREKRRKKKTAGPDWLQLGVMGAAAYGTATSFIGSDAVGVLGKGVASAVLGKMVGSWVARALGGAALGARVGGAVGAGVVVGAQATAELTKAKYARAGLVAQFNAGFAYRPGFWEQYNPWVGMGGEALEKVGGRLTQFNPMWAYAGAEFTRANIRSDVSVARRTGPRALELARMQAYLLSIRSGSKSIQTNELINSAMADVASEIKTLTGLTWQELKEMKRQTNALQKLVYSKTGTVLGPGPVEAGPYSDFGKGFAKILAGDWGMPGTEKAGPGTRMDPGHAGAAWQGMPVAAGPAQGAALPGGLRGDRVAPQGAAPGQGVAMAPQPVQPARRGPGAAQRGPAARGPGNDRGVTPAQEQAWRKEQAAIPTADELARRAKEQDNE
jgi:hypothetical protein